MTTAKLAEMLVWYLSLTGYLLVLCRLVFGGLLRKYRNLAVFAAVQFLQNVVLLWFYYNDRSQYGMVYLATSPLIWLAYYLVVLELYNLALHRYEGLRSFSRKVLWTVLGVAVAASLATLVPEAHETVKKVTGIAMLSYVERGIAGSLLFFLLIIAGFLLWFPVQLTRNAVVHTVLCCLFFLIVAASLFFRDVTGLEVTRVVSTTMLGFTTICLFLWAGLLRTSGEDIRVTSRPAFRAGEEERLLRQLESVNAVLLRSSSRK